MVAGAGGAAGGWLVGGWWGRHNVCQVEEKHPPHSAAIHWMALKRGVCFSSMGSKGDATGISQCPPE